MGEDTKTSRLVIELVNTSPSTQHRNFVSPLNVVLVSPPVTTATVVVCVTCVLVAGLDPAVSASGVMVELMDARKSVNRERKQKSAKSVWLNVSKSINTYIVTMISNKSLNVVLSK